MITGGAAATVYYNLKLRHPTLELPIIDYDLALLFQPMLVLGISIGVALNVIFANWMITILLIILFIVTSTKAFFKGVETWKKETKTKKEATRSLESNDDRNEEVVGEPPPCGPAGGAQTETKEYKKQQVSIIENVYWKELALLVAVWVIILALQIGKNYSTTCSMAYWLLNILQIPVAFGVSSYEAFCLYKGRRKIASKGDAVTIWKVRQLVLYCIIGLLAGIVGGMLGLGGGFILGPLFLEMGNPPSGVECHSHLCHDVFCVHVCRGILPSQAFPSSLCSLLLCCGNCCCPGWATRGKKADQYIGKSISDHIHSGLHHLSECIITRWCRHSSHGEKNREKGVHGI
ncbi:hypothetical protein OIU76_018460 [Salix suchowensis]|nr:hypothetical protein OIU76_018460 [Salix suchowensis]